MSRRHPEAHDSSLLSVRRFTTLIASLVVALGAGTNYAYSAYAPQLGSRLKISHTQLNVIGLAGNVGVYSTGPIWGRFVDARGPRIPFIGAFTFLFTGYSGIRLLYDRGLAPHENSLPSLTFLLLVLCGFMSGTGGNAGTAGAINSTAKTFPDSMRATAVGLVLSGFGLSAFLFSTISRIFFPGDTSHFLLILSLGTALPMILGFFLVRPVPLPRTRPHTLSFDKQASLRRTSISDAGLMSPLLHHGDLQEEVEEEEEWEDTGFQRGECAAEAYTRSPGEESAPAGPSTLISRRSALIRGDVTLTNMFGKGLAKSNDFWMLFVILSLLSGTGVMYINNVGSMSQALYMKESPVYDDVEASKWQTTQVSAISVMNCAGRIIIGLICDWAKNNFGVPRSTSLLLVSFLFFISQVAAAQIDSVKHLWISSSLLGLAHGSVFSLFATMCLEWFGMPHFSENWGYLSIAPVFAGNLFSLAFGKNLDAHESLPRHTRAIKVLDALAARSAPPHCVLGKECYVDTLYLTIGACSLGMVFSAWVCWRDREMLRKAALASEHG